MRRHLIVNADDFGMTEGINEGVMEAHASGIVTSATLMVRRPAAGNAAVYAVSHPRLSLGLHIDLGEWVYGEGTWVARYEVVDTSDRDAVAAEVDRQIDVFQTLVGRGPTHLDSHQHVHRQEPVATVVREAGGRLGVPVRHQAQHVTYRGDFYGHSGKGEPYPEGITVDGLLAVLEDLGPGWSELGCHPGKPDAALDDTYRDERAIELAVLCNPRIRAGLGAQRITLASFHAVGPVPRLGAH
jgi:predicted glycoside hydrolase/deacetylase ChbG (UPF0249 family)